MKPHNKILILNWNRKDLLKTCLYSVMAIDYTNFSVVVIDNGSTDGSLDMVKGEYSEVKILALDQNYGFAGGYNRCFEQLNEDPLGFIMLLNNDTEVEPKILRNFLEAVGKYGSKHIIGAKIFYHHDPQKIWYAGGNVNIKLGYIYHQGIRRQDSPEYSYPKETDYVTGCCLFTSHDVIRKLNGFDESFNMYGEDVDLCLRAQKKGINCYYWPKAKLWHHVSASMGGKYSVSKIKNKIKAYIKLQRIHYLLIYESYH